MDIKQKLLMASKHIQSSQLATTVQYGIGFHSAGLSINY